MDIRVNQESNLLRKIMGLQEALLKLISAWSESCCSMHRCRVLVHRAAPRPVIENIYVVLQRCDIEKYITKKEEQEEVDKNPAVCEVKVALQQFVRN